MILNVHMYHQEHISKKIFNLCNILSVFLFIFSVTLDLSDYYLICINILIQAYICYFRNCIITFATTYAMR